MDTNLQNQSARSHHSLKGSYIYQSQGAVHLNPASGRIGITKKHSLNSKDEKTRVQPLHIRNNSNQIRFDKGYHLNIQQNYQNVAQPKSDNFISLGYKGRETTREYIIGPVQNHSQSEIKTGELSKKIDFLMLKIESLESRLNKIEQIKSTQQNTESQKVVQYLSNHSKSLQLKINQSKEKMNNKLEILKKQIENFSQKFTMNLRYSASNNQQKLQKLQITLKQTILHMKNGLYKEMLQIENKFEANQKADYEKLRSQLSSKIAKITEKKGLSLNIKPLNSNQQENQQKKVNVDKISSVLHHNIDSLANNPYLRLKFFGRIVLLGTSTENPQKQVQIQTVNIIYKIDKEGFLLDENNKYIIDSKNKLIRLNEQQIKILQNNQMLKIN